VLSLLNFTSRETPSEALLTQYYLLKGEGKERRKGNSCRSTVNSTLSTLGIIYSRGKERRGGKETPSEALLTQHYLLRERK